jgi:hypothetical protein
MLASLALLAFAPFLVGPGAIAGFLLDALLEFVGVRSRLAVRIQDAQVVVGAYAGGEQQGDQDADGDPQPRPPGPLRLRQRRAARWR